MIYQLATCRIEITRRQWVRAWIEKYVFRMHSPSAHAQGYDFAWDMYKSIKFQSGWYMVGKRIADGFAAGLEGTEELMAEIADATKEKQGDTP